MQLRYENKNKTVKYNKLFINYYTESRKIHILRVLFLKLKENLTNCWKQLENL